MAYKLGVFFAGIIENSGNRFRPTHRREAAKKQKSGLLYEKEDFSP